MLPRVNASYTPQQLAYLGDAVWSLHVRCKYLTPPKNFAAYRTASERHVSAAQQSAYLDSLLARGWRLSPAEAKLVAWARTDTATIKFRSKFSAASGQQGVYRKATAFEALVGHLSLEDPPRLQELLQQLEPLMEAEGAANRRGP